MASPPWDALAVRAARGRGEFDLAIGEALLRLFEGDRLLSLGYARKTDYARERLGVAARTMFTWTRLARGVADRPLLRRAVQEGLVGTRNALAVLGVAHGSAEAEWVAAAAHLTLGALERRVRATGTEPIIDTFEVESIVLRMSAAQQDRLDAALDLAREVGGTSGPRWQRLEAICQEWLGEYAGLDPMAGALDGRLRDRPTPLVFRGAELPPEYELPSDPVALDALVRGYLAQRQEREEELGRRLVPIVEGKLWRELGFASLGEYCRDRLGIAPRTARQRLWLERRMCALPELREALLSGRISLTKALLLARDATPHDIAARIEEAANTTCQQLERDATAKEDRQNRAAGVRRIWGPTDAAEIVVSAIAALQRICAQYRASVPSEGEALALIADHFVAVWTRHGVPRRVSKARQTVLERNDGLCAVPGCSQAAQHEHHIVFRSRGGSNETSNRVALCAAHHLRSIHRGYVEVTGNADHALAWRFVATGEDWVSTGGDVFRFSGVREVPKTA